MIGTRDFPAIRFWTSEGAERPRAPQASRQGTSGEPKQPYAHGRIRDPVEWMASRTWALVLVPLVTLSSMLAVGYAFASANPLPWNSGYGHTALRVDTNFTVPAMTRQSVRIFGEAPIRAGWYLWSMVYVLTRGSDGNPVMANFQFSYNGVDSGVKPGWGMGYDFVTAVDTQGTENPQYAVENLQPFAITVLENAWATLPPTTAEQFANLVPWILLSASAVATVVDGTLIMLLRVRSPPGT